MPAACLVERDIVRLAEQHGEPDGFLVAHGLDRGAEREAGKPSTAAILAGRNAADTAGRYLAPAPHKGAEAETQMTGRTVLSRYNRGRAHPPHGRVGPV